VWRLFGSMWAAPGGAAVRARTSWVRGRARLCLRDQGVVADELVAHVVELALLDRGRRRMVTDLGVGGKLLDCCLEALGVADDREILPDLHGEQRVEVAKQLGLGNACEKTATSAPGRLTAALGRGASELVRAHIVERLACFFDRQAVEYGDARSLAAGPTRVLLTRVVAMELVLLVSRADVRTHSLRVASHLACGAAGEGLFPPVLQDPPVRIQDVDADSR
jgi:hypothetical protein